MKTIANRELRALQPGERVALLLDAIARGDRAGRDRLWATCRRVVVDKPDIETVELFDRVRWTVAVVAVEFAGRLARLDLLAALRAPLQEDDCGLIDIVHDRVITACLAAHFHATDADEEQDEDQVSLDATTAADDALGFLHDVLDTFIQHDANRVATILHAFETCSDHLGLDSATLLAALCPWIPEQLARHAHHIDTADIDADRARELTAQLEVRANELGSRTNGASLRCDPA